MAAALAEELRVLLGAQAVLGPEEDLSRYTEDWRGRNRGPAACVVLPSSTDQVAAVVRAAARAGVPVVPQGGNTSLCGGAVPAVNGTPPVVLSLARMRRVRAIDAANHSMDVDAGCVLADVQQAAAEAGCLYPVSLGAEGSCQIGGNIATNAGGTGVLRYGNTRDNVLGLEIVLPDGQVWDGLQRLRKNNTGLDLKHLFIGSEGTLGIITGATLKLHPLPTAHAVAWLAPQDPQAALAILNLFQSTSGAALSAYEMLDAGELGFVLEHMPGRRAPLDPGHPWHVLVELADTGTDALLAEAMEQVLATATERGLLRDAAIAASGAQREAMWQVRHSVSEANKKAGIGLSTDSAVPVSAVPEFLRRATDAVRAIVPDLKVITVAHLGDGNVHFIPFFSFGQWQALVDPDAMTLRIKHAVNEVAHALGGTFSAEHGIGEALTAEMAHFKSPVELALMRGIKRLLDPRNLLNPGRLLPPAPTTPSQESP
jgi:FAD/FMN-containing dehydrogenase